MSEFGSFDFDSSDERLQIQAEDLMRQGRFPDAVERYQDWQRRSPEDIWATLGLASALECAGDLKDATQILEEALQQHRQHPQFHRFRQMFFTRREDPVASRKAHDDMAACPSLMKTVLDQLADLFFNQGRYHEALAEFERLLHSERAHEEQEWLAPLHALLVPLSAIR